MYVNYNFLPGYEYETLKYYYFGSKSSQSLLLRMIIEFGFIFLFSLFFLIFKIFNLLKTYEKKKIVYLISVISFLLCKFLKLGSYIDYGTNFFIIALLILCFKKMNFYQIVKIIFTIQVDFFVNICFNFAYLLKLQLLCK